MDIRQIEYVLEVAKTGSIGGAAQNLYLTQPNLSYAIKNLEDELGGKLFHRTNHGIELTDFGRQFLHYAKPFHQQFTYFESICKELPRQSRTSFSVATSPLKFVNSIFIRIFKKYADENVFLSYKEDTLDTILGDVQNMHADIGVVVLSSFLKKTFMKVLQIKNLEYEKLSDESPYVIVGEKNPLYHQCPQSVTLAEMEPYPYITSYIGAFSSTVKEFSDPFETNKKQSKVVVYNRACLYDILRNTNAYSISSNNSNAYRGQEAYKGIRVIPIASPGFQLEIGWVKRTGDTLSGLRYEFISELQSLLCDDFDPSVSTVEEL